MLFSLVIPTYNRAQMVRSLLSSLEKVRIVKDTECEIVIVDNNSCDDTQDVVRDFKIKEPLRLRYFVEKKQGSSHARNRGIREAKGGIIAFLDDDETVDSEWMVAVGEAFERFQCVGVAGKVVPKWEFPCPDWYTQEGRYRIVGPTAGYNLGDAYKEYSMETLMPPTANLAVKREVFGKYGYFRTDKGPVGNQHDYSIGEDTEFCLRLVKAGERLIYSPRAIVYNVVHEDRVTKAYCKRFHFRYGRMQAQLYPPKQGTRRYINVPPWLLKEYLRTLLLWGTFTGCGNKRAGLYYRLKLSRAYGQIYQHLVDRHRKTFYESAK
ncbi:MAG: glycosyltransferase [Candidatus Binatia bacterium]